MDSMDTDELPAVKKNEKLNSYFSRCKDVWLDKAEEVGFTLYRLLLYYRLLR